jgi:AAA15 family ATPase/GTPase
MIDSLEIKNFGPIQQLECDNFGHINLIIGGNGTGKTILLKSLYSAIRTLEDYKRGNEPRTAAEILADKLYWTFEIEKIGDLVRKGADAQLSFKISCNGREFSYGFGKDTTRNIQQLSNDVAPRGSNSIFLPTKEVLSLHHIILESRELSKTFGFDDTYLDLARALRNSPTGGRNYPQFAASRKSLGQILDGKVEYDEVSKRWQFKKGNQKFPIGVTAEGIKKISIIDTLLGNRYLDNGSVIFIDEPESALHPEAISKLLDIIAMLAEGGIQFFMASHSYFVIKKLFLISQEKRNISIPIISQIGDTWKIEDLIDGLPDNPIINESIRLYKEEVGLAFT